MRRELLPVAILAGLALFVGAQIAGGDATATPPRDRARDAARDVDPIAMRARLRDGRAHTYIDALLARDSLLERWPVEPGDTLRVWLDAAPPALPGGASYAAEVRAALAEWCEALALGVAYVSRPEHADVTVHWAERLEPGAQLGLTNRSYHEDGELVRAELRFALLDGGGVPVAPHLARLVALHEVGHAIGLEHSSEPRDVMVARYDGAVAQQRDFGRVTGLSERDVATARLLYSLPPGGPAGARLRGRAGRR